ncbi:MAG: hypothetical protein ACYSU0_18975 [Planctomycetota bacterium]
MLGRPSSLLKLRLADDAPAEPRGRPFTMHQWHGAVFGLRMEDDTRWNGEWTSAVRATDESFTVEMAIPWRTLAEAGIGKDELAMNVQPRRQGDVAEAVLRDFARRAYRLQTGELVSPPRDYTVRLHFSTSGCRARWSLAASTWREKRPAGRWSGSSAASRPTSSSTSSSFRSRRR